jgi:hypothetical protein
MGKPKLTPSVVILIFIPYYSNYLYSTLNLPYMIGVECLRIILDYNMYIYIESVIRI